LVMRYAFAFDPTTVRKTIAILTTKPLLTA
jgi:hypothetical protein